MHQMPMIKKGESMTRKEVKKLLEERKLVSGLKKATITKKLKAQADKWCENTYSQGYTFYKGCRLLDELK